MFLLVIFVDQGFSFWSFIVLFIWGVYLFFVNRLYKGGNFLWKKVIGSLLFISLFSFIIIGTLTTQDTDKNNNLKNPIIVDSFTYNIVKLTSDYQDALLSTRALMNIDIDKISLNDYKELINSVILKWKNVEKGSNIIGAYNNSAFYNKEKYTFLNKAKALGKFIIDDNNEDYLDISNINYDNNDEDINIEDNGEVKLYNEDNVVEEVKMKQVYAEKARVPGSSVIKLIQKHFGGSSKEAMRILESYQGKIGDYRNDEAKMYDYMHKTSVAIQATSTVTLFVGGNILSLGGLTVATTTGGAIVGGLSLGATHALSGVALALQIVDSGVLISTGESVQNEDFKKINKIANTLTTLNNVKDNAKSTYLFIKDIPGNLKNIKSAENLLTLVGFNGDLIGINLGLSVERDNIYFKKGLRLKINDPKVLKAYFDNNYNFLKNEKKNKEKEVNKVNEKKKVISKETIKVKPIVKKKDIIETYKPKDDDGKCRTPYVYNVGHQDCILGTVFCKNTYTNMQYNPSGGNCLCKEGYIEQSHGVCIKEEEKKDDLAQITECQSKCDFATNPDTYTKCIVPCSNSCAEGLDLSKIEDANKSRECFAKCKTDRYNNCMQSCK